MPAPRRRGLGELPPDIRRQSPIRSTGAELLAPTPAVGVSFVTRRFTSKAGSLFCLGHNTDRRYLLVQNQSANTITVEFGTAAKSTSLQIPTLTGFEWFYAVPVNAIYVYAAAAGNQFLVIEG